MSNFPQDWNVKALDECLGTLIDYRGKTVPKSDSGVPLLTARNVRMGYIDLSHKEYVPEDVYDEWMDRGLPKVGDILFTTEAPLGNIAPFPKNGKFALGQRMITLRADEVYAHGGYLLYYLLSRQGQNRIRVRATGSTALGIRQAELRKLRIPLPPLPEQRKIALILGTWDAAIALVEQLIAALGQRKQGLMQRLLTGQVRFPGFEDEWEEVRLGDVFSITAGGDFDAETSSNARDEAHPYPIYSNALSDKGLYGYSSYAKHKAGSVTVTGRGTLGDANYRDHDFTAIGRLLILQPKIALESRFFADFINDQVRIIYESTGVPQLTAPQISTYTVQFPSYSEQSAIAELLKVAEKQIQMFEQVTWQFRKQKRGLMQRLLTGQVRVQADSGVD